MTKAWTDIPLDSLFSGATCYPPLANNHLQLWKFPVTAQWYDTLRQRGCLSDDENRYADNIRNPSRLHQFVIGRCLLRLLLSNLLQQAPNSIKLNVNPHGKPQLEGESSVEFNVSHTNGAGVIALCSQSPVGVDIQWHRDDIDPVRFSKRFFSDVENNILADCTDKQRQITFFKLWTRKEAIAKAAGKPVSFALSSLDTHNEIDSTAAIRISHHQQCWYVTNIAIDETANCSLAVAMEGREPGSLNMFNLT